MMVCNVDLKCDVWGLLISIKQLPLRTPAQPGNLTAMWIPPELTYNRQRKPVPDLHVYF